MLKNSVPKQRRGNLFVPLWYNMKDMNQETDVPRNRFGNVIKSSMKRRCDSNDYKGRRMYMITLVTENRHALFGEIVGHSNAPKSSADAPHISLTPLGERVRDNFLSIQKRHEEVEVIALQMMPDHLHGILFVTTQMQQHLGQIISGFKSGCNKDYRELILGKEPSSVELDVAMPQTTRQASAHNAEQTTPNASQRKRPPREAYDREHGLLFESGYNDKLLLREGQLERWLNYLSDNPRRLLLKREHRDWLTPHFGIAVAGYTFSAIGNLDLLNAANRMQVRISRRSTQEQIESDITHFLMAAHEGAVLVSPAISPGEKAVMRAAFNAGMPLIVLQENGFTPLTKPNGEMFDACAEGRLLLLSPWEHHNDRRKITAAQCQALNLMATALCMNC